MIIKYLNALFFCVIGIFIASCGNNLKDDRIREINQMITRIDKKNDQKKLNVKYYSSPEIEKAEIKGYFENDSVRMLHVKKAGVAEKYYFSHLEVIYSFVSEIDESGVENKEEIFIEKGAIIERLVNGEKARNNLKDISKKIKEKTKLYLMRLNALDEIEANAGSDLSYLDGYVGKYSYDLLDEDRFFKRLKGLINHEGYYSEISSHFAYEHEIVKEEDCIFIIGEARNAVSDDMIITVVSISAADIKNNQLSVAIDYGDSVKIFSEAKNKNYPKGFLNRLNFEK